MASGTIEMPVTNNWKMLRTQYTVEATNQSSDAPNLYYGSRDLYNEDNYPSAGLVYAVVIGARGNGKSYPCTAGLQVGSSLCTLRVSSQVSGTITVQVLYIYK